MKKVFEEPTIEVLDFQTEDILIDSNVGQFELIKIPSSSDVSE